MESSQDKSLPASGRKLQKARDDGQVPRSRDLSHVAVLGAGSLALAILMPNLLEGLELTLGRNLSFNANAVRSVTDMTDRLQVAALAGLLSTVPLAVIVMIASVLSALATGGVVLSTTPITPDLSRINPLSGLERLFSKQQFSELIKVSVITLVLLVLGGWYLIDSLPRVSALVLQPSSASLRDLANWLVAGLGLMLLVVGAVAVVDVPLQRFLHADRLKMTHQEFRQEGKETEGNPHTRNRIRQRQRDISQRNSVRAVPSADFVVMNPTHYAVALKYDDKTMAAPHVVAKGADLLALHIRDLARAHKVPVLQSPVLARALYAHAELDREVPSTLFTAVAQVLAYVYRMRAAMRGEGPMPGVMPEPSVPAALDPLSPEAARAAV